LLAVLAPSFLTLILLYHQKGIVIKYENVEYKRAVQIASLVLDLASKAKRAVRDLLEPPEVRFAKAHTGNQKSILQYSSLFVKY